MKKYNFWKDKQIQGLLVVSIFIGLFTKSDLRTFILYSFMSFVGMLLVFAIVAGTGDQ